MARTIYILLPVLLLTGCSVTVTDAEAAQATMKAARPAAKGPWVCRLWEKSNNGPWKCRLWEKTL